MDNATITGNTTSSRTVQVSVAQVGAEKAVAHRCAARCDLMLCVGGSRGAIVRWARKRTCECGYGVEESVARQVKLK